MRLFGWYVKYIIAQIWDDIKEQARAEKPGAVFLTSRDGSAHDAAQRSLRVSDDPLGAWHGSAHSPRITGHPNVLMVL